MALTFGGVTGLSACATGSAASPAASNPTDARPDWQPRLRGDAVVLLGEVHDNPRLHALRLVALRRAVEGGWRPTVVMEQFDRERQPDLDRARSQQPRNVQHLIDAASARPSGWNWNLYRPVIGLALAYALPLRAANLSATDTRRLVREGDAAVFGQAERSALGLDRPRSPDWVAAQEREIDLGHCGALPPSVWPAMARAQFARDAVMASVLEAHAAGGVVLLAGNGHVRHDLGVPRWLQRVAASRVWSVGYLELAAGQAEDVRNPGFDAVVEAPPEPREDPCIAFGKPRAPG